MAYQVWVSGSTLQYCVVASGDIDRMTTYQVTHTDTLLVYLLVGDVQQF